MGERISIPAIRKWVSLRGVSTRYEDEQTGEVVVDVAAEGILALLDLAEAVRDELATVEIPERGDFPAEDRMRDQLDRFDFGPAA